MGKEKGKIIECKVCSKEFYVPKYRIETAKFCSVKCMGLSSYRRYVSNCTLCSKEFEFIHNRKDKAKYCSKSCYYKSMNTKGTIKIKCHHCEKEFLTSPHGSKKRKFCSRACVNKDNKNTFKPGINSVRGYMHRRCLIKECQNCGYKECLNILGIHHIDRDRKNNALENLIVLCPNCHSLEHQKHVSHHGRSFS